MSDDHGHILVVDDNRVNRLKLSMSLEQQGHTVGLAENGQEALDLLNREAFDVVLLDIMMPGVDGYQVLEKIKGDNRLRDIPVIVISAVDEIDSAVRCINMGAEDYLPKSFNPVLLRARLNSSLQKKKLRDLEKVYLQQEVMLRESEKLATLGRLTAGMAHELNNPAAAARRGAAQIQPAIAMLQQNHLKMNSLDFSKAQMETLRALDEIVQVKAKNPIYLDTLVRSDLEAEMETWMELKGIEESWKIAPGLVNLGIDRDELDNLLSGFSADQIEAAIEWLGCSATLYSLTEEIRQGASRISEIVKALKAYTYLDQAPVQNVNVHEGLDNTLVILRGKIEPGVVVKREYAADLPEITAYGSELNQVWTNLIDNAIDAMHRKGEITLRTHKDGAWVAVEVEDNGPGIPAEILPNIFDPFFTTKAPGQGTGLGLNITHNIIVNKHKGKILVDSRPGKTRFEVKLPIQSESK